jgi:hypothetical protein
VHLVLLPHGSGSVPRHALDMFHQATSRFMQQLGMGRSLKGDLGRNYLISQQPTEIDQK